MMLLFVTTALGIELQSLYSYLICPTSSGCDSDTNTEDIVGGTLLGQVNQSVSELTVLETLLMSKQLVLISFT